MTTKADIVCEHLRPDLFAQQGLALDFGKALGAMLDGAEQLAHPKSMHSIFQTAWVAYAQLWSAEYENAVIAALGGRELFNQIHALPNSKEIFAQIIERIEATNGPIGPGLVVDVNIDDILMEVGDLPGLDG